MSFVKHRFHLAESTKETLMAMVPEFGYDGFGECVFYRTYSRAKADGTMETWNDVVIRVTEGTFSIRKDWYLRNYIDWDEDFWQHYALHFAVSMFKMEWLPPGRGLWAMGSEFVYERGAMALYNCAFTRITDDNMAEDLAWMMDSLMNGVGVGFSPERGETLKVYKPLGGAMWVIPDTREGWVESLRLQIESYLTPGSEKLEFDYSQIRPAGLPIKGFGGVASGPEPLAELHRQVDLFFYMYQSLDWYDSVMLKADIANSIGVCVVAGNVRRSAEILCLPISDPIFLDLKDYEKYPHRAAHGWMSNNSAVLEEDSDFEMLGEIARRVIKNGEPGYINKQNMKYGRLGKRDNVKCDAAIGFNPCQPGWAKVLTPEGIRTFDDIHEGSIIWSECGWTRVTKKWSTGINKVYAHRTTAGVFYGTNNHRVVYEGIKVPVEHSPGIDVLSGKFDSKFTLDTQAIVDGLVVGDGTFHYHMLLEIGENDQDYFTSEIKDFIGETYNKPTMFKIKTTITDLPRTFDRTIPEQYIYASPNIVASFLRGLYSANGSVAGNRVQLKASSFAVIEAVQMMLSSLGISSYYTANKPTLTHFSNGDFVSKQSYDLNISDDREKFSYIIGFIQKYKTEALDGLINRLYKAPSANRRPKITFDIIESSLISEEETFDITVDNLTHTYWSQGCNVSNCGEIPLEHREVCNVAETLPTRCKDSDAWLKACEYCTVYMSTVSLLPTHQPSTNSVVARNRRIGCSIIDFTGWLHYEGAHRVIKYLRLGYDRVCKTNQWVNSEAGVPEAIRKTTMKPGGTVPKVAGKTPGAGFPNFKYTLRRMRVAKNSPIHPLLVAANVRYEEDVNDKYTDVFEFPTVQGPAKPSAEASLYEQAMNLVMLQREWADNAVSNTLNFKPKWVLKHVGNYADRGSSTEWYGFNIVQMWNEGCHSEYRKSSGIHIDFETGDLKYYEFDPNHEENDIEPVLAMIAPLTKSVSLLPHTADGVYAQMPESGISQEEYIKRKSEIKKIDWSQLRNNVPEGEAYCQGDKCVILTTAP